MSMFANMLKDNLKRTETATESLGETGSTDNVVTTNDPLANVSQDDVFAEQRARRNQEMGLENFTQDAPVDGASDKDMSGETDTVVEVPEGEFGEEPTKTGPEHDVNVDADDSDVDGDDVGVDAIVDQELDQFVQEEVEIQLLSNEMTMLNESAVAIERYGMNPSTLMIMQSTGLLNGTALENMACESVTFSSGKDPESVMALEAIGEKIKETAAKWSAKILSVVKTGSEKLLGVLKKIYDGITGTVSSLASKTWDATKAAGAYAKAHPFKTAAAVLAAIVVVGGIVAYVGTGMPAADAKIDAVKAMVKELTGKIGKINFPFGSVKATASDTTLKLTFDNATNLKDTNPFFVPKAGETVAKLGWTQQSMKVLQGQLDRAWKAVTSGFSAISGRVVTVVTKSIDGVQAAGKFSNDTKDFLAKKTSDAAYAGARSVTDSVKTAHYAAVGAGYLTKGAWLVWSSMIVSKLFQLVRFVVVGGFRAIAATVRAVKSAVSGGSPAPATA